jgi:serine/threonine protein phosphatase PrpC
MKEQTAATVSLNSAVVSDRGLSEKRPLNEDSFLADPQRRIFAVADGVGGAQAGEVASQTAMEVLDEAFRHQERDADIEDLMEIAIQRANNSIYRMAQEHPKLSMMATTVVALHLDGHTATIGHVGDSRLYRLTPDGKLHRETRDHSVVEEEVRAGRMTQEQAANHPSRNVISRALGAEDDVEVDLKSIEVEDGTAFLLCSDGITRHIPDNEIQELLLSGQDIEAVCAEMKKRCYERGAEDNLTAVIVRLGDLDRTISPEEAALAPTLEDVSVDRTLAAARPPALAATMSGDTERAPTASALAAAAAASGAPSTHSAGSATTGRDDVVAHAASTGAADASAPSKVEPLVVADARPHRSSAGKFFRMLGLLLLLGAVGAAAFYGGMFYQKRNTVATMPVAEPSPTPAPVQVDPETAFEMQRREVDKAPARMAREMATQNGGLPLDSSDPQFLYLYGRALMLSGDPTQALNAFKKAIEKIKDRPVRDPLKVESKLSAAVAALKTKNWATAQAAANDLDEVIEIENKAGAGAPLPAGTSGGVTTTGTANPVVPNRSQQ